MKGLLLLIKPTYPYKSLSFGFGLDSLLYLVAFSVEDGPEGVVRVLGEFLRQDSNHPDPGG